MGGDRLTREEPARFVRAAPAPPTSGGGDEGQSLEDVYDKFSAGEGHETVAFVCEIARALHAASPHTTPEVRGC